jgi:hypothetical protein
MPRPARCDSVRPRRDPVLHAADAATKPVETTIEPSEVSDIDLAIDRYFRVDAKFTRDGSRKHFAGLAIRLCSAYGKRLRSNTAVSYGHYSSAYKIIALSKGA